MGIAEASSMSKRPVLRGLKVLKRKSDTRKLSMPKEVSAPYGNPIRKKFLPLAIQAICSQWSRFQ